MENNIKSIEWKRRRDRKKKQLPTNQLNDRMGKQMIKGKKCDFNFSLSKHDLWLIWIWNCEQTKKKLNIYSNFGLRTECGMFTFGYNLNVLFFVVLSSDCKMRQKKIVFCRNSTIAKQKKKRRKTVEAIEFGYFIWPIDPWHSFEIN